MKPLTISADKLSFLEDGKPWIFRGTLDWLLYYRYLTEGNTAAVRAVVQDRRSVGANTVCCELMYEGPPTFGPQTPEFWAGLRPFAELCESEQMRLCLVAITAADKFMPDLPSQFAYWERVGVTLGDKPNVSLIVSNQPGHAGNHIDVAPFKAIRETHPDLPNILCCRENPNDSQNPTLPPLDFCCICTRRDWPKSLVDAGSSLWYTVNGWPDASAWPGTQRVTILFEPPHGRETGEWSDPGNWRQLARSLAFKGTGGANFYSDQCAYAQILTGHQRDCAVEFLGNIPNP